MIRLRGITWDQPRGFDPMAATARQYQHAHPEVEIHWEKRSLQAFADQPLAELCRQYDLLVIDHPHLEALSNCGGAAHFDAIGRDDELALLASQSVGASHDSYFDGTHQWALAIDAATQVAVFRPDLLEEPPPTWHEMLELARRGKVLWPAKPVDAISTFNTLLANLGKPLPAAENSALPEGDAHEVLALMAELSRSVPHECLALNPPEVLDWLASDANSQFAYCPLLYGYANYSRHGFRAHELLFVDALGPAAHNCAGTQLGGAGIAVSAHGDHVDVAQDYAFWIASAECQRTTYFESGGQPANALAWEDCRVNTASRQFFKSTRRTLDNAWMRPRHGAYLEFQDQGGRLINDCLRGIVDRETTVGRLVALHRRTLPHRQGAL